MMIRNTIAPALPAIAKTLAILEALGSLILLLERFWMARIFFKSGLTKIDDWSNTLYLFANEYNVPLLPPALAATGATVVELCAPVFLILGLATRLATLPMLAMTAVIQFTYESHPDHAVWAMLLATILCFGPGKISVDYWLKKKLFGGV
jgi:putative oxidoreductase